MEGGTVEFRLDAVDGPSIGKLDLSFGITSLGQDETFTVIEATKGVHDLYVTFSNSGEKPVTGLISFYFSNEVMNN